MIINKNISFLLLIALCFLLSCDDKREDDRQSGSGWLSVEFLTDKSVQTRGVAPVYALQVQKPDGSVVVSYDDCSVITERILLPAGTYKLVAFHGEDVLADFEKPFYKGEQEIKIENAVTKEVSIICTQANVKVSVEYSDLIKSNFPDYSLEVVNGEGKLIFAKDEARSGFLRVNESTMVWNLTLNNGQEVYHLNKTITNVAPRQHYRFSFDIKEDGAEEDGAFVGGIVVDTTTDIYNWICEIVLKENIAKPEIKRMDGIGLNEPVLVLEKARGVDVRLNIAAQARMQSLIINHKSATIKGLGIPEVLTLTDISDEVKAAVNGAGITWGNEPLLDAQEAMVDFSGIANKLPLGDYQFFVSVYDARNRLVRDTLRISVIPDIDHIADEVNVMDVWGKFATIRARWYTLVKPEGMALEYSVDQMTWTTATQTTFNEDNKTFSAYLKDLEPNKTYYFRTTSTEKGASETVRQFTTEQALQLPDMNMDTWYKSGKVIYVGSDAANKFWDSGNEGASSMSKNPTDGTDDAVKGRAAKMVSQWVGALGIGKFAAGNLYSGKFAGLDGMNALLDFGRPYTCRPLTMTGYYKYFPKTINNGNHNGASGKMDKFHIYVVLCDWSVPFRVVTKEGKFVNLNGSDIIAFGEAKGDQEVSAYEKFTINIHYRDNRKPKYILVVATASEYGDYFTGGEGSTLFLDELEFGFDSVE